VRYLPIRAVALAALVALVFLPVLSNGWVSWDDPEALVDNGALRSPGVIAWALTTSHMSHFQPGSWLVWASTGRLLGTSPEVFHGLSLLFHCLNSVLLFFVVGRLAPGRLAAAASTLLYAVHPLRVEPVAWASAFPYLLSTSFLLAATLLYLRRSLRGSAVAYGISILARPLAPGFPLVLLALDDFPGKRDWNRRLLTEKVPFFVIAIVGLFLEGRSRRFADLATFGIGARLTLASDSLLSHFGRLLWPMGLTPLDPLPLEPSLDAGRVALGALIVLGTAALAFRLRARFPAAPVLWISWLALLLPSLGLTPSGLQATADRYSYVPGLVVAVAIGAALKRLPSGASSMGLALAALLGVVSFHQCQFWKDSITLWSGAVELDPKNDLALYFRASALSKAGRLEEARRDYNELLEMIPEHGPARKDLARLEARDADALASNGELDRAIEGYSKALGLDPGIPEIRERRAMALFQRGRFQEALPELGAVISSGPSSPEVAGAYALLLSGSGRNGEALATLEKATHDFPDDVGLLHNLARLLATQPIPGREDEAVTLAERVVEKTGGNDPRALDTLGFALAARGAEEEASRAFDKAVRLARASGDESLAREIEAHARSVPR
jgi:protein O-mannosyl-transferase